MEPMLTLQRITILGGVRFIVAQSGQQLPAVTATGISFRYQNLLSCIFSWMVKRDRIWS